MRAVRGVFALLLAGGLAACSDEAPTAPELDRPQMASVNQVQTLIQPVTGTLPGGGTFAGTAQITNLAIQNGQLVASGVLNGVATVGGVATNIVNQAFTAVSASLVNPGGGKCDILHLDLGPLFLDLLGLQVDLSQIVLDIDAVPGAGNLLGNLLCAVTNLLNNPSGNLGAISNLLNRISNLLGGIPALLQAVTGTLPGGGTFAGTAQITNFVMQNGQLVAQGVLNGVATVGGVATPIVNQVFSTPVNLTSASAATSAVSAAAVACDILHLDLGPIFLDLLGLQVDLSQIVLDIDAVPGAGNLLGNLLCGLVGLLDPLGDLATILNILDQINNLLG